jgi:hypothetical protein
MYSANCFDVHCLKAATSGTVVTVVEVVMFGHFKSSTLCIFVLYLVIFSSLERLSGMKKIKQFQHRGWFIPTQNGRNVVLGGGMASVWATPFNRRKTVMDERRQHTNEPTFRILVGSARRPSPTATVDSRD